MQRYAGSYAEVAQLVEQWSEEPPPPGFLILLDNSRLIPIFGVKEQWFQWSIVLECGGQAAFRSYLSIHKLTCVSTLLSTAEMGNREC